MHSNTDKANIFKDNLNFFYYVIFNSDFKKLIILIPTWIFATPDVGLTKFKKSTNLQSLSYCFLIVLLNSAPFEVVPSEGKS